MVGGLEDRLPNLRETLLASGNDCKALVESKSGFLEKSLKNKVRIKIMCVDPQSAPAVETLARIDPRFSDPADFTTSMQGVERVLTKLRAAYAGFFEFRYMPVAPSVGLYISDPGLPTELMKVEMYTPKPWNPVDTRPHVIVKGESVWRDYFLGTWDNYWAMSRIPA
jgi:hypothetical protein